MSPSHTSFPRMGKAFQYSFLAGLVALSAGCGSDSHDDRSAFQGDSSPTDERPGPDSSSSPDGAAEPGGQVQRDADFSGRWAVQLSAGENDCGFPSEVTDTFVDITQSQASLSFLSLQGVEIAQGEVAGARSQAHSAADIRLGGRSVRYANEVGLQLEGDRFSGVETFGLEDSAGNVLCSGQVNWQGSRSIVRSMTGDPLTAVADVEPNDTVVNAVALLPNTAVTGEVSDVGDRVDIYTVPLSYAGVHAITLTGFATADLSLALIDKHHNLLATSENAAGADETLTFAVDANNGGALYVIVSALDTGEVPQDYLLELAMP